MKTLIKSLILVLMIFASQTSLAEKMDSETQNLVISRLEDIISGMQKTDSSWTVSNIRLADLLAERARRSSELGSVDALPGRAVHP